jgi:hypothetical protein
MKSSMLAAHKRIDNFAIDRPLPKALVERLIQVRLADIRSHPD